MDDENISQAITQAGGCLTLHSKWKSQFDDSEASENETEMKGENLQSPEHKQGESPGTGNGPEQAGVVSTARQLELSRLTRKYFLSVLSEFVAYFRITENTSHGSGHGKEGEKSRTSPVHDKKQIHVEVNKPFHNENPAKNSLHIEVNLPLPPAAAANTKQSSVSPDCKVLTETTGKILQLGAGADTGASKPCVVIPPPPKEIFIFHNLKTKIFYKLEQKKSFKDKIKLSTKLVFNVLQCSSLLVKWSRFSSSRLLSNIFFAIFCDK